MLLEMRKERQGHNKNLNLVITTNLRQTAIHNYKTLKNNLLVKVIMRIMNTITLIYQNLFTWIPYLLRKRS